jgi:nucleoside phosphorylase
MSLSQGRRFRFGTIGEQKVVIVMTGLGMVNKMSIDDELNVY